MKIDLHCHTKKTKTGDGKQRNVTPELFKEKIALADIRIVAITNHNVFDVDQYMLLQGAVTGLCQVWPGVEIDVQGESKFHLIVVTKPEDANRFSSCVNDLFGGENIDVCQQTLEKVCETFKSLDAIYIPHFHDKKPAISEGDRNKLIELVGDSARVFIEPRNHRTLGVLSNKDLSVMIGSDVKDWNKYEECTFAELRLSVGNFSEFLLLARRDRTVVNTLLSKKPPVDMIGKPHHSVSIPLSIYPDVNIIFGSKGTGKTEILKSLFSEMLGSGKSCKKYIASERSEDFSALTNLKDMDLDLDKVHSSPCEEQFRLIFEWTDCNPTLFSNYLDWAKTKGNSNSKSRMKITEAIHDNYSMSNKYDIHKSDKNSIDQIIRLIQARDIEEYLSADENKQLLILGRKLQTAVLAKREAEVISQYSSKMTNWSIDKIKALSDKSTDTISRPSTAGLKSFARGRIQLIHVVKTILTNLNVKEHNEKIRIGSLEDKGEIFINHKYRMLCPEARTANYPNYNITNLRQIKTQLEYIRDHVFDDDLAKHIESFSSKCTETSIKSIKPFLGRSKQIVDSNGEEYEPSNGEKGILLLQQTLHEDADAYFLDEPELGMGNSYIDTDIRPIICDLAKRRKYVVVATHNANIAVRSLPYTSIFRTHNNSVYKTYIGNPFDDLLVNVNDKDDILSWTEESMHSLEGGHDAFYERRDIYEARGN
ncbi:MAG: histidinol phosphatase [Clostridia bacterium]|nr:histidinol phosphatase [Clostridia bacterium]